MLLLASLLLVGWPARAGEPEPPCESDCALLAHLAIRGDVRGTLTFELRGGVRARHEQRIALFGPPSEVHLEDVTIDGGRAEIGFDDAAYYLLTSRRTFTLRGKITLGKDALLSIPGPLLSLDAHLSRGRLVEGDRLSGLANTVLHFDPMTGETTETPKTPPTFRLSRALRFGRELKFVYLLSASQAPALGTVTLPLRFGEKVIDVQGAQGYRTTEGSIELSTSGTEATITITGTIPFSPEGEIKKFSSDERSSYEWWLVEADPEHRVSAAGDMKLVETSQSPIPATMPGARVYLLQRGQVLEIDGQSLVRGEVLAAVARENRRFVAVTGRGEVISDETLSFDNNGLDHLTLSPAGKPIYVSTDGNPQPILHGRDGSADLIVSAVMGSHLLRLQSLGQTRLFPLVGVATIPESTFPITTSAVETTIGMSEDLHPIAVLGGDRARWAFSAQDAIATALGIALSCCGFRTRKTRTFGSIVIAGLWFVSRTGFVVAAGGLFVASGVFLASRFWRGNRLLAASAAALVVALLAARAVILEAPALAAGEPSREMFVIDPELPKPETFVRRDASFDPTASQTPVSLSFPVSDRYVRSSRQLVTRDRPVRTRVVYVTSTVVAALHLTWAALVVLLVWAHRDRLLVLKDRIASRLRRRAEDPALSTLERPPFGAF